MKDFLKILFVLVAIVAAFVSGRNYGEQSILESKEYKDNKSNQADGVRAEEELKLMKDKFQALLDSADLKKADEVYGKMMTLFLVDLGLRISEAKQKDLDEGKAKMAMCTPAPTAAMPTPAQQPVIEKEQAKPKEPRFSQLAPGRFKSTEWTLTNSNSNIQILMNLEKVKLTDIDAFLKNAPETPASEVQKYLGTFRGSVRAVDGSNYGSLVIQIGPAEKPNHVKGDMRLYRRGNEESSSSFTSNTWGYTPVGYQGNMVSFGPAKFLQIYKIENADKIAGNFYERLPNGTTKLIGSFILSRTDRI